MKENKDVQKQQANNMNEIISEIRDLKGSVNNIEK